MEWTKGWDAHDLNLLNVVPQTLQLLHPTLALLVWIVPRPDRAHARRLVTRVALRGVLKVRVGPSGAVDADVTGHGYVWAPVGFAHDGYDGDLRNIGGNEKMGGEGGGQDQ